MRAKLIRNMPKLERIGGKLFKIPDAHKSGDVIDDPDAYILVRQGVAVPDDEECSKAAGMSPEAFEKAKHAYNRLAAGIDSEDFKAYDAGLMVGYKPDGEEDETWIPGPNWVEGCEDEYYSEDEDDDE